ncbi:MAG: RNA-binding domain-containing protein [Candidatus Poseidoniales archaeon]|jgi:RNA binding exosome subunit|tara:strand:- start:423 stop:890 length:468 start_codon:yes stop_codon:yes gene_type:complete
MPFANLTWRATASGLEDELLIADALSWLCGEPESIGLERTKSYHGSKVHMITSHITRRGAIRKAISNLGPNLLNTLLMQIDSRLHDDNALYFRIDLDMLVRGKLMLSEPGGKATAKARLKFKAFPGQDIQQVVKESLQSLVVRAQIPTFADNEEE